MKTLLLLLALSLTLSARVGEKYSDYAKRIGQAEKAEKLGLGEIAHAPHEVNGIKVGLGINNGVITAEAYTPIEPERIEAILAEQDLGFKKSKETATQIVYVGKNELHSATYNKDKKKLAIANWDPR
jgi:hypothetical protein